jgi:hypothetical protein
MTTRRRRVRTRSHVLGWIAGIWAVIIGLALMTTALHVIGWLAGTTALCAVSYAAGRRQTGRALTGKLRANARYGRQSAAQPYYGDSLPRSEPVSAYPASMHRERANGWTAPGRSVLLSAECAGDECVWCHDSRCQHDCGHVSRNPAPAATAPLPDKPPF